MNLHIFYRASSSEKTDVRPSYYSKLLCLKSLLRALSNMKNFSFSFYYDGEGGQNLIKELKTDLPNNKIKRLFGMGNSRSFWQAYSDAIKFSDNDWVYFVEDDYLHVDTAIQKLVDCIETVKCVDYITLFDHPVRYASDYHYELDVPHRVNKIYISKTHHWRTQESTCMTFASRVSILKEDKKFFERYVKNTNVPKDRELFRRLQGLTGYEDESPRRLLIGPIPSLATHCHLPWMSPVVDWEDVAKQIKT